MIWLVSLLFLKSLLNAKTNLTENDPSIIDLQLQLDFMKADFVKTIIAELKSLKTRVR